MAVIDRGRVINDSWTFGICENCGHNPEKVKMVKEQLTSGDPDGKHKSDSAIWVCPKCGYTRKL